MARGLLPKEVVKEGAQLHVARGAVFVSAYPCEALRTLITLDVLRHNVLVAYFFGAQSPCLISSLAMRLAECRASKPTAAAKSMCGPTSPSGSILKF